MKAAHNLLMKTILFSIQQEKNGTLDIDAVIARALPCLEHLLLFHELWTEKQVTEKYRFSPHMLRNMRYRGMGPAYIRIGSKIFYRGSDVLEWIESGVQSRWRFKD